jgi:hypothetical protein
MLKLFIVLSSIVNAAAFRRERAYILIRLAILILLSSGAIGFDSLYIKTSDTGIGIYDGLFLETSLTHSLNLFISYIGAMVLLLTAFLVATCLFAFSICTDSYLVRYKNKLISKMGEQFTIIEYPLIILFTLISATFLMSICDLVSMFLAIELQSNGLYFFGETNGCVLFLVPAAKYSNADIQPFELRARMFGAHTGTSGKEQVVKETKGKSGIYR